MLVYQIQRRFTASLNFIYADDCCGAVSVDACSRTKTALVAAKFVLVTGKTVMAAANTVVAVAKTVSAVSEKDVAAVKTIPLSVKVVLGCREDCLSGRPRPYLRSQNLPMTRGNPGEIRGHILQIS